MTIHICTVCGATLDEEGEREVTFTASEVERIIEEVVKATKRYCKSRVADHVSTRHKEEGVTKPPQLAVSTEVSSRKEGTDCTPVVSHEPAPYETKGRILLTDETKGSESATFSNPAEKD